MLSLPARVMYWCECLCVCVCVCSRWERADKCALAAHPNNVIICIFIQIVACYIMILYTVEYLT